MQTQQNSYLHFLQVMCWARGQRRSSGRPEADEQTSRPRTHVAAAVLLDRGHALWTLLGVRRDPVGRLRVVGALLQPALDERADARLVIGQAAAEAERVPALALDCRHDRVERLGRDVAFDRKFAVGRWTPPQRRAVVDVGAVEQDLVPAKVSAGVASTRHALVGRRFRHEQLDRLLVDDELALGLHALDSPTLAVGSARGQPPITPRRRRTRSSARDSGCSMSDRTGGRR